MNCIKHFKSILSSQRLLIVFVFVTLLFPSFCRAGLPEEQPGSRAISLGYSAVALDDSWSLFYNQASLGFQKHTWVGVHHENRFITPELNFSGVGFLQPVWKGTFGLAIKRMGFSQFNQSKFGLAYGMQLAPSLYAGVQMNFHHVFIGGEYGSTSAFSTEGGLIYTPSSNLTVGAHILNPTRSKIHNDERIPTILNLGIAFRMGENVLLTSGAEKNIDAKATFKAGLEFIALKSLALRIGTATEPSLLSFGMGYQMAGLQIDFAFTRHEYLGYTPHFSLSYLFGQRKKPETIEP